VGRLFDARSFAFVPTSVGRVDPLCYPRGMRKRFSREGSLPSTFLACSLAAWVLLGSPLGIPLGPSPFEPRSAEAAVAIAYTLDELVMHSERAIVGKAVERKSQWEEVAGSKRIVTYTKIVVQETMFGGDTKEIWVRTLGGAVGRIGQQVAGEANIAVGEKAVMFLARTPDGALVVTGMAQGHFPVRAQAAKPSDPPPPERLAHSPSLGTLLPRKGPSISAQTRLVGKTLSESLAAIRTTKAEVDAREKK
jgi:hypothetical protein